MLARAGVVVALLSAVQASPRSDGAFIQSRVGVRHGVTNRYGFRLRSRGVSQGGNGQGPSAARPENVVIIGSGPAGYTAAIYCARANLKPLVFEGATSAGGQLMATSDVENFPGFPEGILGPDLMANMRKQAVRWGSEIESEDVTDVDFNRRPFVLKTSSDKVVEANSLILATGAAAKRLFLPNEDKYWSRGITACAICDGAAPMYRDEPLAVVGGGDSAVEEAVYLTKYSPEVHLLVRGSELRASKAMQDRVRANSKVIIHYNTAAKDVYGDDPDKPFQKSPLRGIHIVDRNTGKVDKLPVRGLFYAIGHDPNTNIFKEVTLDDKGYIKVKPGTAATSVPGVFAAGDVQDPHWRQAVTAAGTGCMAALSAERYLTQEGLLKEFHQAEPTATAVLLSPEPAVAQTSTSSSTSSSSSSSSSTSTAAALHFKGEEALKELQSSSARPTLVMFASKTCGPCRILKPILTRVLKEFEGQVNFVEIDIEESPDLTLQSGVAGTPTVLVFQGEDLRTTLRGVKKSAEYKKEVEGAIADSA